MWCVVTMCLFGTTKPNHCETTTLCCRLVTTPVRNFDALCGRVLFEGSNFKP